MSFQKLKALLPANTTLPSIGGLLQLGQLLSVVKGGWTGTEPISYSYQWYDNGTAISGANLRPISLNP